MFKSLKKKFLIINMSIISIVMITAFAVIFFTTYGSLKMQNIDKLKSVSVLPIGVSQRLPDMMPPDSEGDQRFVVGGIPADYSLSFNLVVSKTGEIQRIISFIDMTQDTYTKIAEIAFNEQKDFSVINIDGQKWMYHVNEINGRIITRENGIPESIDANGALQFTFLDVTETDKTLTTLLIVFALVGFGMLFVIFAISLYFASRAIKPISQAWDKQKQFITDASHELKTPIAIINANSDVLLANKNQTIESQQKWLDYIGIETGRMSKLVNDLLYLAKTENMDLQMEGSPFNISDIVSSVALSMEAIVYENDISLSQDIEPNIITNGDSNKIKQVAMILLDNAVKYTNAKGQINIVLKKTKRSIIFSVTNTGIGIPEEKLPLIFDRFYRADPARTHENGGYGLGLSIAKAIIERHGGKIHAKSTPNKNTIFTFTLNI